MRKVDTDTLADQSHEGLLRRNEVFEESFEREAPRLAEACHEIHGGPYHRVAWLIK